MVLDDVLSVPHHPHHHKVVPKRRRFKGQRNQDNIYASTIKDRDYASQAASVLSDSSADATKCVELPLAHHAAGRSISSAIVPTALTEASFDGRLFMCAGTRA